MTRVHNSYYGLLVIIDTLGGIVLALGSSILVLLIMGLEKTLTASSRLASGEKSIKLSSVEYTERSASG